MSDCSPCLVSCVCTWNGFETSVVPLENFIAGLLFQKPLTSLRLLKMHSLQTLPRYLHFLRSVWIVYFLSSKKLFVLLGCVQVHFVCSGSALGFCILWALHCLRSSLDEPALVLCRWQLCSTGSSKERESVTLEQFISRFILENLKNSLNLCHNLNH